MEPLLDHPDALKINCESNTKGDRIWIRVAFDATEKGRIFGRSGRTIQAIRTLLTTTANNFDQTVRFDVFDFETLEPKSPELKSENYKDAESKSLDNPAPRLNFTKPKPKLKSEIKLETESNLD